MAPPLNHHLNTLENSGLIRLAQAEPELEYLFRHALIQDAVYESLLKSDRRVLHRAVADALERLFPKQLDELAGVIGQHYHQAQDPERAQPYLVRAGDVASQHYATAEAIAAYSTALSLTPHLASQIELHLKRGDVFEIIGDWPAAEADYTVALAQAKQAANTLAQTRSLQALSHVAVQRGDYDEALQYLEQSLDLTRAANDQRGLATTLHMLGRVYFRQGDHARSEVKFQESLALRREIGDSHDIGLSLNALGSIAVRQGDLIKGRVWFEESLSLFRRLGDKRNLSLVIGNMAKIAMRLQEYATAWAMHEESLALYQEIGDQAGIADAIGHLGMIAYEQGQYDEAQRWYEQSLALHRATGDKSNIASTLSGLGDLAYQRGDYSAAGCYFQDSLTMARDINDQPNIAYNLFFLGVLTAHGGQLQRAVRLWAAAEAVRSAINIAWGPVELELYERVKSEAQRALGNKAFVAVWDEGQRLSWGEAVELALATTEDKPHT